MTWTSTPPTTPGFYAWRRNEESCAKSIACNVFLNDHGILVALRVRFAFAIEPALMGGQWCKLVPADEIEKAWIECVQSLGMNGDAGNDFNESRAKQVMEGLE